MKKNILHTSAALFLALALGLSGCGSKPATKETAAEPAKTEEKAADAPKEEAPKEEAKTEERPATTLTVAVSSEGREASKFNSNEFPDENWTTKYLQEKFAKPRNIDLKYQLIDDTDGSYFQNIVLLMASKNAPDVFGLDIGSGLPILAQFIDGNALLDLSEPLAKNGPDLVKFLGDDFIKEYGTFNGKQYAIPGHESIPAISHYWIRTDWLTELGLKMPTTFDEWYETMKAFKAGKDKLEAAGLIPAGGEVYPYEMYHTRYFTDWERIVTRFYPSKYFDPANLDYYISGYGTEYLKEGFKEGMQFMNQMYNEGLINPNFALDTEAQQFASDIVSGNAGSYCDNLFNGWGPSKTDDSTWQNLTKQNIAKATFEWCHPFTNKYDNVIRNPLDPTVSSYTVVPAYSTVANEAVEYLNYMANPDVMVEVQFGELGVTYDMDPVLGPIRKPDEAFMTWGHETGPSPVLFGRLPDPAWSRIQRSGAKTKEEAEYAEKIHAGIEENGYVRFPMEVAAAPEKNMVGALRGAWQKFCSDLIMAKPNEFEKVWEDGVKEMEANGSQKIVEGYKKAAQDYFTRKGVTLK